MARNYCYNCGAPLGSTDRFCGECGTTIDQSASYQYSKPSPTSYGRTQSTLSPPAYSYPPPTPYGAPGYVYKRKTGWLTFVIIINIIEIIFLSFIALIFFLASEFDTEYDEFFFIIFIVIVAIIGLLIWLTTALNNYNNTARIIMLILTVIGFIGSLATISILTLVVEGLIIYALAFHQETVELFITPSGSSYHQPPHYDQRRY